MKFRLSVPGDQAAKVKSFLSAHGIEIGEDAEYVILEAAPAPSFLTVRSAQGGTVKLADNEIVYIEAFGRDIEVHTLSETYFAQERMYQLEEHLDSRTFIRVSKSVIISRNHVKKIRPSLSMKFILTMSDGTLVDVTRSYYSEFRRFFHI